MGPYFNSLRPSDVCTSVCYVNIVPNDDLPPGRRQAIIRPKAVSLAPGPLKTSFSEIWETSANKVLNSIDPEYRQGAATKSYVVQINGSLLIRQNKHQRIMQVPSCPLGPLPTKQHVVTAMFTRVHISVAKSCILKWMSDVQSLTIAFMATG